MGWYILAGTLAAFGCLSLIWVLFGWLLPAGENGVLIIPGRPDDRELLFVRRYLWLRDLGLLRCTLLVADLGLTDRERQALEAHGIEICGPEALPSGVGIGAKEIDGTGNGNPAGHHRRGGVPEL